MGNSPVVLDFSKAQPLTPTNPDAKTGVTLDFSKAQPIFDPDAFMARRRGAPAAFDLMANRAAANASADFWRGSPSVPGLPIQESTTMTPEKMRAGAITAGKTAVASAVAGSAAIGAGAALAPTVGTATIGTGLFNAAGEELTKDIATEGPSLARAGINFAVNAIKRNRHDEEIRSVHMRLDREFEASLSAASRAASAVRVVGKNERVVLPPEGAEFRAASLLTAQHPSDFTHRASLAGHFFQCEVPKQIVRYAFGPTSPLIRSRGGLRQL